MLPLLARNYILIGLENTPTTLAALLTKLPADSPRWEVRTEPDRFTLREIVAHLADWEDVFQERFERVLAEDSPTLLRPDLDQRAEEKGYSTADPHESLVRFARKRSAIINGLRSVPENTWARSGHLVRIGDITFEGLTALMLGHDSYHTRQIAEWLAIPMVPTS